MGFFEWDPRLSVGIAEIDRQHQKLIGLISILNEGMRLGKEDMVESAVKELTAQASVINEMVDYSKYHFSTEERYMHDYAYPGYKEHKDEHESFIRDVQIFKNDFEDGKVVLSTQIMEFLKKWLSNHILSTDKKYEPFFRGKGLR